MPGNPSGRGLVTAMVAVTPTVLVHGRRIVRRVATTPGRLRLASILGVGGVVLLWAVVLSVLVARHNAARNVGLEAAPLLVDASELYVELSDADATASRSFLQAGPEAVEVRNRYREDIAGATERLSAIASRSDSSAEIDAAVLTVTEGLTDYAGRVEAARSNIRQNLVVGAAYLRDASRIMRERVLPAATDIYASAARRLDDNYQSGSSPAGIVAVLVVGVVLIIGLFVIQTLVSRWSNRTLNLGLVGATGLVVVIAVAAIALFIGNQNALVRSQEHGTDPLQVLSAGRTFALRAHTDVNLALIERGTGETYVEDFRTVTGVLAGDDGNGGLLGVFAGIADRSGSSQRSEVLLSRYRDFLVAAEDIRERDAAGDYEGAVALALADLATAADELDAAFESEITLAEERFFATADDARRGFGALATGLTAMAILAAVFVVYGLAQRIREYR